MTPRTILVPVDFSPCSERALDHAFALAVSLDATVHLVTVSIAAQPAVRPLFPDQVLAAIRRESMAGLEKLAAGRPPGAKIGQLIVVPGDPRETILQIADDLHADMIVMGTHGRRGLSRLVLGSVAEEIVRRATCPVLTVRQEIPS